jgi:hypothetical protein
VPQAKSADFGLIKRKAKFFGWRSVRFGFFDSSILTDLSRRLTAETLYSKRGGAEAPFPTVKPHV